MNAGNAYARAYRLRHKALGLCPVCPQAATYGGVYCDRHRLKNRERNRHGGGAWRPGFPGRVPLEAKPA